MKFAHGITRAGLAFIVFGGAASLLPANGNASAATDGCTVAGQSYSVGDTSQDPSAAFTTTNGTRQLKSFLGTDSTTATSVKDSTTGFTTTISGGTVTTNTTAAAGTVDTVTVNFPGGRVVTYMVTAA